MRRAPVRIRTFIFGTVLVLLVLPLLAGATAFVLERHHQQAAVQRRLDAAFSYLTANRTEMKQPARIRAFAALLDRLGLFAEVNLVMKVPPGKAELYLSPALIPAVTGQRVRQLKTAQVPTARSGTTAPASKTPATGDRRVEREIPVITRDSAGALIADLYYAPASRSEQALAALVAAVGVLLVGLAVAFWLAGRWMVAPLTRLSAEVDKVAGGDLEIAVPRSRIGEIANIAQAVEGMTVALGESAQRRAEANEARRFLVTSVAHDLRTPLFALRGHLQAIRSRLGDAAVHLARAEARADALERLVGNLFAFTRDDYTQPAVQLEVTPGRRGTRGGRGRARARGLARRQHIRARRRQGRRRLRRPRSAQARAHQHRRQRAALQPARCSGTPRLGTARRVDCGDRRSGRGTGDRARPVAARLRARHPRDRVIRQRRRRGRARPRDCQAPPRSAGGDRHRAQPAGRRGRDPCHPPAGAVTWAVRRFGARRSVRGGRRGSPGEGRRWRRSRRPRRGRLPRRGSG